MKVDFDQQENQTPLRFYGGSWGALLPFLLFVSGVIYIALSGAPDERGFWPILLMALAAGLFLSKDRSQFSETVISGMSQQIVMVMIMAWILASTIGVLMTTTGFVEALTWVSLQLSLGSTGFVVATFIICCIVSLSTGSSFATILICTPILYPSGGVLGAHLPTLAGAVIAGATFGDFFAPISDTTIASTLGQKAEIGAAVRSRIMYIVPAALLALICFIISNRVQAQGTQLDEALLQGSPKGLPMLLVPVVVITLFLKGKHLIHGLLAGLVFGIVLGLALGLLPMSKLLSLDLENFTATSFIIDGINRAVGISFFTILLMGLVGTIKASGLIDRLVQYASTRSKTKRHSEAWITGTVGAALLLTTHSIVAILMVTDFSNKTGEKMNLNPIRRANLLSLMACVLPFVLPYFIPVILMANMTSSGQEFGLPSVPPLQVGLHNFLSWFLLIVTILVVGVQIENKKEAEK